MPEVAVIDVETTGLAAFTTDRVVEVAALVVQLDGTVVREFVTLVNPERDIGPTRIHGLTARDVREAPTFRDIAGALLETLAGCVAFAAHNVTFDRAFLEAEYHRLGHQFPAGPTLCTMRLAGGGSLPAVCSDFGISVAGSEHSAYHDARAAAGVLAALIQEDADLRDEVTHLPPIAWPLIPGVPARLLHREEARAPQTGQPSYIQKLLAPRGVTLPRGDVTPAVLAYVEILTRALEDRIIDEQEAQALVEYATRWDIPPERIQAVHRDYLACLADLALADGVLTDTERCDLELVAFLLGIDNAGFGMALRLAEQKRSAAGIQAPEPTCTLHARDLVGKRVCFTGEGQCRLGGEPITRAVALDLAERHGMISTDSVTKALDILVVADPYTQSGKARKARRYGVRIIQDMVFWRSLGVEVE